MRRARPARTVVVTGASAGVGRAVARAFGARGDRVALLARNPDGLAGARRDVEARGGRALVCPVDVADHDAVESAAVRVEEELGEIDVWVNSAMAAVFAPFLATRPEEFRRATEVVYLGSVHGAYAALRRMQPRDRGHLVQVGSALAYRGIPLQSAYCGSKHALQGFYDSVRSELRHDGSRVMVTSVHMPALNTPQFRLGRSRMARKAQPVPPIYQPEVAADAVVWASEHRRRELWVGASAVGTIVGARGLPAVLLDRYLGRTGYESQLTDEPEDAGRADYLLAPVPGDHGAHGPFDDRAMEHSVSLQLAKQRPVLVAAAAVAALAGLAGLGGVASLVERAGR